jgi:hypothetical protein
MTTLTEMAKEAGFKEHNGMIYVTTINDDCAKELKAFATLVRADERKAIYDLVMEAPFKEFDRQEEDFDGEAANAMKAMAFSLTCAIRARSNT